MNLIVDTSVWSLILRRREVDESDLHVMSFRRHVENGDGIFLLGPILQELLDGVRTNRDFENLIRALQPFPLAPLERTTFIQASKLRNQCRRRGVQASPTDFLIATACIENGYPLLTADGDFSRIAGYCKLILTVPPKNLSE